MTTNEKYKLELSPYYLVKDEESCGLCANHFYGKFLNYIDDDDYVGASLAKRFLKRGNDKCVSYKNNRFKKYFNDASNNKQFNELKSGFFND